MCKNNVDDPVKPCPLKDLASILVEVVTYRSGKPKPKTGLKDVDVSIQGTTKKPDQKTQDPKGRTPLFAGLVPGSYTVTLSLADNLKELYDFDSATPGTSDTKDVPKRKTQSYYFEIPWFWLDHEIKYPDGKTFAKGIDWVLYLKKPQPNANFAQHETGTSANAQVSRDKIPRGRYKLALKVLWDPAWSAAKAVVDTAIDLSAKVAGFDQGTDGTFEICDAHAPNTALKTLNAKVTDDGVNGKQLKTAWTPAKADLAGLKSAAVVFRAKVSGTSVLSSPLPVFNKEKYEVVDQDGAKVDTPLEVRFSGGYVEKKASVNGEVEIEFPWNETLARLDLPGKKGSRVSVDEGGIAPARKFLMPA